MDARMRAAEVRSDELYPEAEQIVRSAGEASTSYLQRRLGIGYARAAALMEMLEERGVISGPRGAAPRKVLLSPAVEKVLKKIEEQLSPKREEKKGEKKNEK
jgi:DNA segregation ATPase FtsK/SpoIIIE-like protein